MCYPPGQAGRTRELLTSATAQLLCTSGFSGMTVAGVMKSVGLTHGSFYLHFPSKEAMVTDALERLMAASLRAYRSTMGSVASAGGVAEFLALCLTRDFWVDPDKGFALPALAGEMGRAPARVRSSYADALTRLVSEIVSSLVEMGVPKYGAETLADSLVAETCGACSMAAASASKQRSATILQRAKNAVTVRLRDAVALADEGA